MDNSLIPRAFSPTDAKREREANAREAERRSSARNASASAIGEGGKLTLSGGIDVVGGGTVKVIGQGMNNGVPYEVTAEVTNFVDVGQLDYQAPGMLFSSALYGQSAARIYSRDGRSIDLRAIDAASAQAGVMDVSPSSAGIRMVRDGAELYETRIQAFPEQINSYIDRSAGNIRAGMHVQDFSTVGAEVRAGHMARFPGTAKAQLRTQDGGKLWLESSGTGAAAIVMDGTGSVDIQGTLTNNGAPISGGGGGASSWDELTGKPTVFPPSAHTHAISDVTGLAPRLDSLDTNTPTEITYATGYSFYGTTYRHAQYIKQGNIARLLGMVGCTASTISMTAGTLYTLGSIPLSIAPAADELFGVIVSGFANRTGQLYVQTDGSIKFNPHQSFTGITKGQFYVMLGDAWWPV